MSVCTLCLLLCALLASVAPAVGQSATATGGTRDLNPAVSVNTLLLGRRADSATDRAVNGLDLQEAEAQFTSVVDPFWKANLVFAVHPAHDHGHAGSVYEMTSTSAIAPAQ